jgi:hypothetical protein
VATDLSAPGVYVELVDPPVELDPVDVDVAGFVGVFERGPIDRPAQVSSWPQVEATFGSFVLNGIGAYALKGWLDNGGRVAYVVRVAAPAHETTLVGAQPPDRRSSVVAALDGLVVGAAAALEQDGRTWMHLVADVDTVASRVTWDRPLHPDVDLTQLLVKPVHVRSGAAPAATALFDEGALPVLELRAATPGAWGNHLSVLVERRFHAATTNRIVPGVTGNATPVAGIDGFSRGDLVRVSQDAGGGVVLSVRRVVETIDPARSVLFWDSPLTVVDPTQPLRVEAETFTLSVRERGRLVEVQEGLSLVPGHPRFAPNLLDRSAFVRGEVPSATPPPPASGHPILLDWAALVAGRDGTAALSLDDLLGDELTERRRGLATFATVDEPAIMAIPDLVAEPVPARIKLPPEVEVDPCLPCPPPPPPPDALVADISEASASFDVDEIALAQQALIDHCERRADRIALLDPPCGQRPLDVQALTAWRSRFDSTFAAMYAPWVVVVDPFASVGGRSLPPWGRLRRLPPSGHVAGLIARVDAEVGAWAAPANRLVRWVHATDTVVDTTGHGILNDAGVDALRAQAGRGVAVLGARTIASDASWRFISVRRLFLLVERTLRVGLAWTVFEPAGPALDRVMATAIGGLLEDLWERGAFAGETPESSFFVKAGGDDRTRGEAIVEIGIAPQRPAEVILLQVVRTEDRLEIREQPERSV